MLPLLQLLLLVASIISVAFTSPLATLETLEKKNAGIACTELLIPVSVTATNLNITADGVFHNFFQNSGTYNIAARYCEPTYVSRKRANTLQLLVHGITYNRNYWSGDGAPGQGFQGDTYSWIAYAAAKGYPTLAIDRLGNGLSSHPDPILETQLSTEVETVHQVILKARSGQLLNGTASRTFSKVIFVGHSYGSILGDALTAAHPTDVDAAILTGWTPTPYPGLAPLILSALVPAALIGPDPTLNPYYLELNSSAVFQQIFYYPGNYDTNLFNLDYSIRGTVALGEVASATGTTPSSPDFTGHVLLIAGQKDFCFCPTSNGGPECGTGWSAILANTAKSLFPAVQSFAAYSLPKVGHCWQFHDRARLGFNVAHDWLGVHGF